MREIKRKREIGGGGARETLNTETPKPSRIQKAVKCTQTRRNTNHYYNHKLRSAHNTKQSLKNFIFHNNR